MSKKTHKGEDEILDEAIRYVIAASKGQIYKYPEGWDKNMKRSVRKRAEQEDGADNVELRDDELKDGHWLSCDVINCAQSLLKK